MNDLIIKYGLTKRLKIFSIVVAVYLFAVSVGISVFQTMHHVFDFFFYVGIAGVLFAILLVLTVTIWQSNLAIIISSEALHLNLPAQKVRGSISWETVTHAGIGLSYLTLQTNINKNYKIDLENLKYKDLRNIKTKLIEVCEAKNIPFNNL